VQIEGRRLVLQEGLRGGSQDDGSFGTSVTSYFYAWWRHLSWTSYVACFQIGTSPLFRSDVTSLPLVTSPLFPQWRHLSYLSDVTSLPGVTSSFFPLRLYLSSCCDITLVSYLMTAPFCPFCWCRISTRDVASLHGETSRFYSLLLISFSVLWFFWFALYILIGRI
jgi:hypothetical protein